MKANLDIPWEKIYNFVLTCGYAHELNHFCIKILTKIEELCPFDQALIYFLDGNGKVCNQYLMNIDEQWSAMYLGYYSKIEGGRYGLARVVLETSIKPIVKIREWEREPPSKFIYDYIRPRGLKYSLGFALFDINGIPRTVFALDRTKDKKFTNVEVTAVYLAVLQLNNLHKNLFYRQPYKNGTEKINWETIDLTPREREIVDLLCQGVSPANISKLLHISRHTTYSHIAHIYEKMNVSSRQELLVRLLG
ncbi:helix-turn-helix transcriptional regulator [Moorella sulfitireducens]|uniref:helix-turn-helix transcriptional regulator n=1 Tax=Neomoorella sulfitireducens TaxID=2972948 RepID=UPI0021AB9DB0|nr:helix-turn-helix transcriptional regulator [Moorella sulfitireducens]